MTTPEVIDILHRNATGGCLAPVVRRAIIMLEAAASVKVALGEAEAREVLLRIYERRLHRSRARGIVIPGLSETVECLQRNTGAIRGGYAETSDGLVYFWLDKDGALVGCVMKPSRDDDADSLRR